MLAGWRTVRVFISSTFRDMHSERDHLVRFVFPRLRRELLKWRVHFVDVDLRWGVTSEQDATTTCREIIDDCRPRFLCMLGGRYGTIPPEMDRSITADEVHYAVFDHPPTGQHHFFYFRDPAATASMVERVPGEFREPEGSESAVKLEELKQAVAARGYEPFVYTAHWDETQRRLAGLEDFGNRVYQDLLQSVADELGRDEGQVAHEFASEDAAMEAFAAERIDRYVVGSRRSVLDDLAIFATSNGTPNILVVTGDAGSGKSALLSRFALEHQAREPDAAVLSHFVGVSSGSTSLRGTLRRLCHHLGTIAGVDQLLPEELHELIDRFWSLLKQAAVRRRIVLVIDALNQMDDWDDAHSIHWLPRTLPENVRIVVSSLEHPVLDSLRLRRPFVNELYLAPLNVDDARAIVLNVLHRYRKRVDETQLQLVLKKQDAGNPLYLLVALEELRTLGGYEEITERIQQLPGTTRELFLWILRERLSSDPGFRDTAGTPIGARLVRDFVSCLGISRHGLSQQELAELVSPAAPHVNPPLPADTLGNVAALQRLLQPYLMHRSELLDFYHVQLREAVEAEYLDEQHERIAAHRKLADYFHERLTPPGGEPWSGDCPRSLSELPFHQMHGEPHDRVAATLTDLRFIAAKCAAGLLQGLHEDYRLVLANWPEFDDVEFLKGYSARGLSQRQREGVQRLLANKPPLETHTPETLCSVAEPRFGADDEVPDNVFEGGESIETVARLSESRRAEDANTDETLRRVRCFQSFVFTHGVQLSVFPRDAAVIAHNYADSGPVAEAGRQLCERREASWLARLRRPAPPPLRSACRQLLRGHSERVTGLVLAPDGESVVSSGADGTLRFWNLQTGAALNVIKAHDGIVAGVAWSRDGRMLVTGGYTDREIAVWDAATDACQKRFATHKGTLNALAATADGRLVASAGGDAVINLWDTETGERFRQLGKEWNKEDLEIGHIADVVQLAMTGDGRYVASAGSDRTLRLWDVRTSRCLSRLSDLHVSALAFSGNDRLLFVAAEQRVLVFELRPGQCLRSITHQLGTIESLVCSKDGRLLVVGSREGSIAVWNVAGGRMLRSSTGHYLGVKALALADDLSFVVSGSDDRVIRVWDPTAMSWEIETRSERRLFSRTLLTPDLRTAISANNRDQSLVVWDAVTEEEQGRLDGHTALPMALAVSPEKDVILSAATALNLETGDARMIAWRWPEGDILRSFEIAACDDHDSPSLRSALSADWSRDGLTIASGYQNSIYLWDWPSGRLMRTIQGEGEAFERVLFSVNARVVYGVERDSRRVQAWDIDSGEWRMTFYGHHSAINHVALSASGEWLVTSSMDRTLRVWDTATGGWLRRFELPSGLAIRKFRISPDDSLVVGLCSDDTLRVFHLHDGSQSAVYSPADTAMVSVLGVGPDGRVLAGSANGQLHELQLHRCDLRPPLVVAMRRFQSSDGHLLAHPTNGQPILLTGTMIHGSVGDLPILDCPWCGGVSELPADSATTPPSANLGEHEAVCPLCTRPLRIHIRSQLFRQHDANSDIRFETVADVELAARQQESAAKTAAWEWQFGRAPRGEEYQRSDHSLARAASVTGPVTADDRAWRMQHLPKACSSWRAAADAFEGTGNFGAAAQAWSELAAGLAHSTDADQLQESERSAARALQLNAKAHGPGFLGRGRALYCMARADAQAGRMTAANRRAATAFDLAWRERKRDWQICMSMSTFYLKLLRERRKSDEARRLEESILRCLARELLQNQSAGSSTLQLYMGTLLNMAGGGGFGTEREKHPLLLQSLKALADYRMENITSETYTQLLLLGAELSRKSREAGEFVFGHVARLLDSLEYNLLLRGHSDSAVVSRENIAQMLDAGKQEMRSIDQLHRAAYLKLMEGRSDDALQRLQTLLGRTEAVADEIAIAELQATLGMCDLMKGRFREAKTIFQGCLGLLSGTQSLGEWTCHQGLASLEFGLGSLSEALVHHEQACRIAEELPALYQMQSLNQATQLREKEIREARAKGDDVAVAIAHRSLARIHGEFGDLKQAVEHADAAIRVLASHGQWLEAAQCEQLLAGVLLDQGETGEALARFAAEAAWLRRIPVDSRLPTCLAEQAELLRKESRDAEALNLLKEASDILAQHPQLNPELQARIQEAQGLTYWKLDRLDDAAASLKGALEIARRPNSSADIDAFECLLHLAVFYHTRQQYEEEVSVRRRMLDLLDERTAEYELEAAVILDRIASAYALLARPKDVETVRRQIVGLIESCRGDQDERFHTAMQRLEKSLA